MWALVARLELNIGITTVRVCNVAIKRNVGPNFPRRRFEIPFIQHKYEAGTSVFDQAG